MASSTTTTKVKTFLRISHSSLDGEIGDWIDACIADLTICGVQDPIEDDPLILNCVKLFVKAHMIDDTKSADDYMGRYNDMKSCLMMAHGYGGGWTE